MSEPTATPPEHDETDDETAPEAGVAEALRAAVERTMRATAGSAATTRDRAADLVDELARRGQEAGAELARRGQEATGEVGRRLELLERRLAELEHHLGDPEAEGEGEQGARRRPNSEAEG
jgi:polyhydroxyalkanoate synthesis regulator phasin